MKNTMSLQATNVNKEHWKILN